MREVVVSSVLLQYLPCSVYSLIFKKTQKPIRVDNWILEWVFVCERKFAFVQKKLNRCLLYQYTMPDSIFAMKLRMFCDFIYIFHFLCHLFPKHTQNSHKPLQQILSNFLILYKWILFWTQNKTVTFIWHKSEIIGSDGYPLALFPWHVFLKIRNKNGMI